MDTLSKVAIDFVIDQGACAAGISTLETLKGGPPSADLTYVLSNAKSAIPEEENYCNNCGMCVAGCASGFIKPKEKITVSLGGIDFSYSGRGHYMRCGYVCAGYTGLRPSGKWSTWSPGRFPIPENDDELLEVIPKVALLYGQWPRIEGGFYHVLMDAKLRTTCANCQFICFPDLETRKKRYKMLTESGVVVQKKDGPLEAVTPEKAQVRLKKMSPDKRRLYQEI